MTHAIAENEPAKPVRGAWNWTAVLAVHLFAAATWWWMMPHGFSPSHPRFWVNEVLPLVVIALTLAGMIGFVNRWLAFSSAVCLAVTIFWWSLLGSTVVVFPESRERMVLPVAVVAGALAADYWFRAPSVRLRKFASVPVIVVSALVGIGVVLAERAPDASTEPRGDIAPVVESRSSAPLPSTIVQIARGVRVDSKRAVVHAECQHLSLEIEPLLTFESVSPDRCWTIFAPPGERVLPARTRLAWQLDRNLGLFSYEGDGRHVLRVRAIGAGSTFAIESFTTLDAPVYSHLNSCCQLVITGHRRLAVGFSPCPELRVDVGPADYPVGRPATFAYLDSSSQFHVVEATSGEKGPFIELGSGILEPDEPLALSLYDNDRLVGSLALTAWAHQASTEVSPTAGWGVPMNAIEFRRLGEGASAPVAIWMTLAGTSVGRGWDSVGHREGRYYNLLVISPARTSAR